MDPLAGSSAELQHLPKIVLTELSGKTFEAHQRLGHFRAKRGHQRVERRLAPSITAFPYSPQNLQRSQIWRFLQNLADLFPESRDGAWPPDLSLAALRLIIDVHHRTLFRDALHRAQRNPAQARYFGLCMTGLQQNLDFVSF
jgi:hypothetical protein